MDRVFLTMPGTKKEEEKEPIWKRVSTERCELECPACSGRVILQQAILYQLGGGMLCPYCKAYSFIEDKKATVTYQRFGKKYRKIGRHEVIKEGAMYSWRLGELKPTGQFMPDTVGDIPAHYYSERDFYNPIEDSVAAESRADEKWIKVGLKDPVGAVHCTIMVQGTHLTDDAIEKMAAFLKSIAAAQ